MRYGRGWKIKVRRHRSKAASGSARYVGLGLKQPRSLYRHPAWHTPDIPKVEEATKRGTVVKDARISAVRRSVWRPEFDVLVEGVDKICFSFLHEFSADVRGFLKCLVPRAGSRTVHSSV